MINGVEETVKWQDGQRWSGQASLSFLVFITISVVVFFRIGCQLVITAWLAVQLTGRANAVGTILLISSVTHLVCSPVIGKLVDTFKKKEARDYLWSLGRGTSRRLSTNNEMDLLKSGQFCYPSNSCSVGDNFWTICQWGYRLLHENLYSYNTTWTEIGINGCYNTSCFTVWNYYR